MRWTSRSRSAGVPPAVRWSPGPSTVGALIVAAGLLMVVCARVVRGAPAGKRLSVYSVAAKYVLPVVLREGRDYVGLLEVLEPLGKVSAKLDSRGWRLRYNNVEAEFQVGKTRGKVQGRDVDLGGKLLGEKNRGLVPITCLASLLPRFLGGPATLHEESGRLFIGSVATHFTASLSGDNPPRLVFHFTAPVNPSVSTEPGALRMTFSREPLVAPASPTLTFGSKAISSANYTEGNGAAMVTVNATIPVIASFSSDGRTVTISPTSSPAPAAPQPPAAPPPLTQPVPAQPTPAESSAPPATVAVARRYFAVVDASHGGDD